MATTPPLHQLQAVKRVTAPPCFIHSAVPFVLWIMFALFVVPLATIAVLLYTRPNSIYTLTRLRRPPSPPVLVEVGDGIGAPRQQPPLDPGIRKAARAAARQRFSIGGLCALACLAFAVLQAVGIAGSHFCSNDASDSVKRALAWAEWAVVTCGFTGAAVWSALCLLHAWCKVRDRGDKRASASSEANQAPAGPILSITDALELDPMPEEGPLTSESPAAHGGDEILFITEACKLNPAAEIERSADEEQAVAINQEPSPAPEQDPSPGREDSETESGVIRGNQRAVGLDGADDGKRCNLDCRRGVQSSTDSCTGETVSMSASADFCVRPLAHDRSNTSLGDSESRRGSDGNRQASWRNDMRVSVRGPWVKGSEHPAMKSPSPVNSERTCWSSVRGTD